MVSESRIFNAKYSGQCKVCGLAYFENDPVHFIYDGDRKIIAHCGCHTTQLEKPYDPGSSWNVKSKRKHEKHCSTCGLEHAGEC